LSVELRGIMKIQRSSVISFSAPLLSFFLLLGNPAAYSQNSKDVCADPSPAQMCTAANTCGSASSPCSVDVKRTANSASSTPSIPNAKGNSLFCVSVGTTVTWKSTDKGDGFVVDFGASSPFDPAGAIRGGSARSVSVVTKGTGCFKYSVSACHSGEVYGMCGTANPVLIVIDKK
jgi:plastocyanin